MSYSVTYVVKHSKQPYGGVINRQLCTFEEFNDDRNIAKNHSVHASLVGMAVDYLTRFLSGAIREDAFSISLLGAEVINMSEKALSLLGDITGLNDKSIVNAVKLSGFDVCYRAGVVFYKPIEDINPDKRTIKDIYIMVERSLKFLDTFGPIVLTGFDFEGAYTDIITAGDGDYLTEDTLWDLKVRNQKFDKNWTLQLLFYWRMGLRSVHSEFKNVKYLGVLNPKLNLVFYVNVKDIDSKFIARTDEVIGYTDN